MHVPSVEGVTLNLIRLGKPFDHLRGKLQCKSAFRRTRLLAICGAQPVAAKR